MGVIPCSSTLVLISPFLFCATEWVSQEDYCVPLVVYITISKKNTIQKAFYRLLLQITSDCWLWPLKQIPRGDMNVV